MIRSTTNTAIDRTIGDIQAAASRLDAAQRKLSSGKEIGRPEDDPFGAGRAMFLRSDLGDVRQFRRNVAEGQSWIEASDISLHNATGVVQRVRELTVQAANGALDAGSLKAIGAEISQLRQSVREQMNTSYAGRFLFAGSRTLPEPGYAGPYAATTPFASSGNADPITRPIAAGETIAVNVTGAEAFEIDDPASGAAQNLLRTLERIEEDLGTSAVAGDRSRLGTADLDLLDLHLAQISDARAKLGARGNRLDTQEARLQDMEQNVRTILSKTEDADMARTMIDYSTHQAGYQAALQVGAKVIQPTLLDFLR